MSNKKLVDDDYYNSNENTKNVSIEDVNKEKKPKIVGKIKIKKDNIEEKIENKEDSKKPTIKKPKKDNIVSVKEEKEVLNYKTSKKTEKKSDILEKKFIKKDTNEESSKEPKKYFTTEKTLKNQEKKDFNKNEKGEKREYKISFKKDCQNNSKNFDSKNEQKNDNDIKKSNKSFNTKTKVFDFLEEDNEDNTNNKKEGITIINKDKPKKFINQIKDKNQNFKTTTKKSTKEKEIQENSIKKGFKKDKSNKHSKNFLIQENDEFSFSRSNKIKKNKKEDIKEKNLEDINQNLVSKVGQTVIVDDIFSVKEFSDKIGLPVVKVIQEFIKNGLKITLNSKIDFETASIIAESFNIKLEKDNSSGFHIEDMLSGDISSLLKEEDSTKLEKRIPVVSIMGHVDHGKTSLLDYLRKTKVAAKEAGGITQSIGAYEVKVGSEKITFLDTPGHEAFTIMRARGAKSTDIAILVVAGDDGVKPQTVESINHAIEAGLQIIVAVTKIDKPGANIDMIKSQLATAGLLTEGYGGNIPVCPVSSKTGEGIDNLLEIIILTSEILDLKANPNRTAVGTVLESHLDTSLGPVSSVLINTGTLKKGDCVVCKGSFGRIKVLKDFNNKNTSSVGPGEPALIVGFDSVLNGGDIFQVVSDIEKARIRATEYKELMDSKKLVSTSSIDLIMSKIKSGSLKQLKVIVKSDTNGSLEAIKGALLKLSTPETKVSIIHSGVGNITESDAMMGHGSNAIIVGYNVDLLGNSKNYIENSKIEYISSKVIYHITEKIEKIITGMLDSKEVDINLGTAKVGGIFFDGEGFQIIGLKLNKDSTIEKGAFARVIRKDRYIGKGKIENLKSGIVDVNNLEGPTECGIKLVINEKIELGDEIELFKTTIIK